LAVPVLETGKGGGKAEVRSGLILSGAFIPDFMIGVGAVERINPIALPV
jgi:hypothetical protein